MDLIAIARSEHALVMDLQYCNANQYLRVLNKIVRTLLMILILHSGSILNNER